MPSKPGRDEEGLLKLFVSGYENRSWNGSDIRWLDQEFDSAVDALVTRADGQTMAIEHTLVQPFTGDVEDFKSFEPLLAALNHDRSLSVPNALLEVFIPVGTMFRQTPAKRDLILRCMRDWLSANRLSLQEGEYQYECEVPGQPAT